MYKLYGHNGSGSAAIEMALNAVGEPYDFVDVASWEPDTPIEELTDANPLSQIPTLITPDGSILTESAATLIYLGDRYPSSGILSSNLEHRTKTVQGLVFLAANCYPAVGIIDFPQRWSTSENESDLEKIKIGTRKRLYYLWEIFADSFSGCPYLSGSQVGILDFYTITISRMFSANKHLKSSRPGFYNLLSKLEKEPLISSTVQKHWGQ